MERIDFIVTREDVVANIRTLYSYLNGDFGDDYKAWAVDKMKRGHNFVVEIIDGMVCFGPSRFVGYLNNTKDKHEQKTFNIDAGNHFRSFAISTLTGNSGSWHLYSAVISGVPLIEAPTNLQSDEIKGTRCRLLWTNPENAVSNCVEVSSVQLVESMGRTVEEFGLDEISAGGNSVSFAKFCDSLPPHYEKLSGTYLYAAANSAGLLQISTGKNRGELVYSGRESYTDLTLRLILKRYSGDANTMTIGWTDGGSKTL